VENLIKNNIEIRPLVCGSMGRQPFYTNIYGELPLENCDIVEKFGCYIPNHPSLTDKEINKIIDVVNSEL